MVGVIGQRTIAQGCSLKVTRRDVRFLRDLALSHALTRDQIISLGYFGSVTRANARLRRLVKAGLIHRLATPFYLQSIYSVTKLVVNIVGERIAPLVRGRAVSPRFLQHALTVTEVRLAVTKALDGNWFFEQQLWRTLNRGSGKAVRPDGLVLGVTATFVEVDLGHVAPSKFREKLLAYQELALTEQCMGLYGFDCFSLMTITTGKTRAHHLNRLTPRDAGFDHKVVTFAEIGVAMTNSWS